MHLQLCHLELAVHLRVGLAKAPCSMYQEWAYIELHVVFTNSKRINLQLCDLELAVHLRVGLVKAPCSVYRKWAYIELVFTECCHVMQVIL